MRRAGLSRPMITDAVDSTTPTQQGPKSVNDELTRVGTVLATATQTVRTVHRRNHAK